MHHFSSILSEVYHIKIDNQSVRALEGMMKSEDVAKFYSDSFFSDYRKFHSLRNTYFVHNLERFKLSFSFYGILFTAITSTKNEYENKKPSKDCSGISTKYNNILEVEFRCESVLKKESIFISRQCTGSAVKHGRGQSCYTIQERARGRIKKGKVITKKKCTQIKRNRKLMLQ
eukprot:TRINITY_DN721_c0_g2_i5.p1 TRINITY_DN721_c0_g2~~TRINITY_DN721_c0_g2_i5.p1  ORF type:complete len:173 (-),score=35.87 TRINITY_DN721_c0_g2_i5:2024-2542(-)